MTPATGREDTHTSGPAEASHAMQNAQANTPMRTRSRWTASKCSPPGLRWSTRRRCGAEPMATLESLEDKVKAPQVPQFEKLILSVMDAFSVEHAWWLAACRFYGCAEKEMGTVKSAPLTVRRCPDGKRFCVKSVPKSPQLSRQHQHVHQRLHSHAWRRTVVLVAPKAVP